MPMPDVGDFRTEIGDDEKRRFVESMQEVQTTAMRDAWERLHGVLAKAVERLKQPDAIFRDTLIENIREVTAVLPALNLTDDARLEQMRVQTEAALAGVTATGLRDDAKERADKAAEFNRIMSAMGAFMGSAPETKGA